MKKTHLCPVPFIACLHLVMAVSQCDFRRQDEMALVVISHCWHVARFRCTGSSCLFAVYSNNNQYNLTLDLCEVHCREMVQLEFIGFYNSKLLVIFSQWFLVIFKPLLIVTELFGWLSTVKAVKSKTPPSRGLVFKHGSDVNLGDYECLVIV